MKVWTIIVLTLFGAVGLAATKIEYFIESNQDELSQEMAQGEGQKLSLLAELSGCASAEAQSAFAGMARKSFEKIIPAVNTPAPELEKNLQQEIAGDDEVLKLCQMAVLSESDAAKEP